jgi:hypothetical protein
MHESKVEELRKYFQTGCLGLTVQTDWDVDLRAWSFRFDEGAGIAHLLKISWEVLGDYTVRDIITKLEGGRWKAMLQEAGNNPIIFTRTGFKPLTT